LEQATYTKQYFIGYHRPIIGKYESVFEARSNVVESHPTPESVYERTPVFYD